MQRPRVSGEGGAHRSSRVVAGPHGWSLVLGTWAFSRDLSRQSPRAGVKERIRNRNFWFLGGVRRVQKALQPPLAVVVEVEGGVWLPWGVVCP